MSQETKRTGADALEASISDKQETALQNHSEIMNYVREVKEALDSLVDKVAHDQEATSNLFADIRHELQSEQTSQTDESADTDAIRQQVVVLENAQENYETKRASYKQKLEQSKKQLRDQAGSSGGEDALRLRAAELENRLLESTETNDVAKRRIANLEEDLKQKTTIADTAETLQQKNDELASQNQDHVAALDASRAALESITPENEAAKQKLEAANATNEQFKKEIDALTEAAAQHNYKIKELEVQQSSNLQQVQDTRDADQEKLHEQIETLESSLSDASRKDMETSTQIKTLKLQLNEAKERNAALKGDVADRVHSNVGHKEGIDVLQDQIDQLEGATESSVETISGLRDELVEANAKAEKATERLEELRSHAKKTLGSEKEKAAALKEAQAELSSLREDTEARTKLLGQRDALESQVSLLRERNAAMEEQLVTERADTAKSTLAQQLTESLQENEASQELNESLQEEITALKEQLEAQTADREAESKVNVEFDEVEAKQKLGDLLLETRVITKEQLDEVLTERREGIDHGKIGQAFIDKGFATEDVVVQALAHQMEVPFLRIEHNSIRHEAIRMISERMAENHVCIPIRVENERLVVAMQNPMDLIAIEDIERIGGYPVDPVVATPSNIREAIATYYQGKKSTL